MFYIYGIINKNAVVKQKKTGLQNKQIMFIHFRAISAVVSLCNPAQLSVNKSSVLKHTQIIESIYNQTDIIPFQFGVFLESELHIKGLIKNHYTNFKNQLYTLRNQTEYGFKIYFEAPVNHKKDKENTGKKYLKEKVRKNQLCREIVSDFQEKIKDFCTATKQSFNDGNTLFLDLFCLVPRESMKDFEYYVHSLEMKNNYVLTGPWPPYNFVNQINYSNKEKHYVY